MLFSSTNPLIIEIKDILAIKCKEKQLNKTIDITLNFYDIISPTESSLKNINIAKGAPRHSTSPPLILTALNMSNSEYP